MSTHPTSDLEQLKSALSATASPTRHQARAQRRWLYGASAAVLVATASLHGWVVFEAKPWRHTVVLALAVGSFAASLASVLQRYHRSPLGPRRALLRSVNLLAIPGLLLASALPNLAAPETLQWPAERARGHIGCTLLLLASGAMLAWLAVLSLRRAAPLTPRATAATIGAAAGAWASLAVSLQCTHTDPLHTLGTHVLPVAILMLLTARFGARALALHDPPG